MEFSDPVCSCLHSPGSASEGEKRGRGEGGKRVKKGGRERGSRVRRESEAVEERDRESVLIRQHFRQVYTNYTSTYMRCH